MRKGQKYYRNNMNFGWELRQRLVWPPHGKRHLAPVIAVVEVIPQIRYYTTHASVSKKGWIT
jgi:hypothetical protein